MPPVRRGLNDRVQLNALEAANQRAAQQLRVAAPAEATRATEPEAVPDQERNVSEQAARAASDPVEKALWAALTAAKTATIAFGIDALLHANSPRFRGKAMRVRAIGYVGSLF